MKVKVRSVATGQNLPYFTESTEMPWRRVAGNELSSSSLLAFVIYQVGNPASEYRNTLNRRLSCAGRLVSLLR